jgi:hypothetical protein
MVVLIESGGKRKRVAWALWGTDPRIRGGAALRRYGVTETKEGAGG